MQRFLTRGFALKSGLLQVLALLASPAAYAQTASWQTAVASSGGAAQVAATATDASGNVYLAGSFYGASIGLGTFTLTNADATGSTDDVFVAKWSPATNAFVWAQRGGGTGRDVTTSLAVSGTSVYVAGWFANTPGMPAIPTATFGTSTLTGAGAADGFLAKLTDAGTSSAFSWAQRVGGANDEFCYAVAANGPAVYIGGAFHSTTAQFGPTTLTNAGGFPINSTDIFVTKLTDAGSTASFGWTQQAGGTGGESVRALAVSGANVYVAGTLFTDIPNGGTPSAFGSTAALTTRGSNDVFVAKITDGGSTGPWTWVAQGGGVGDDQLNALAVRGTELMIAGQFAGQFSSPPPTPATFGPAALTSVGGYDAFVAQLTDAGSTGSFTGAQSGGGPGDDEATALALSGPDAYVAGYFRGGTATFGSTSLTNSPATGSVREVFVARLSAGPTRSFTNAYRAGGTGNDEALTLALYGTSVYVAGSATLPATFGSQSLTGTAGNQVAFLARLADPTLTATAAPVLAGVTLHPNPTRSRTILQLPALPGTAAATLSILDALGRTVQTETLTVPMAGLRHELNIRDLAPGVYAVRVGVGSTAVMRRLVVE